MENEAAIGFQQSFDMVEIFFVMADPDMLEHTHGNDFIEGIIQFAIVKKQKFGFILKSHIFGALVGNAMLLMGKRNTCNICTENPCKIKPQSAPTAADIKELFTLLDLKLGRKMPFFGKLCFGKADIWIFKITT